MGADNMQCEYTAGGRDGWRGLVCAWDAVRGVLRQSQEKEWWQEKREGRAREPEHTSELTLHFVEVRPDHCAQVWLLLSSE